MPLSLLTFDEKISTQNTACVGRFVLGLEELLVLIVLPSEIVFIGGEYVLTSDGLSALVPASIEGVVLCRLSSSSCRSDSETRSCTSSFTSPAMRPVCS